MRIQQTIAAICAASILSTQTFAEAAVKPNLVVGPGGAAAMASPGRPIARRD